MRSKKMAGVEGVEPSHTAPETAVLPLDDTPVRYPQLKRGLKYYRSYMVASSIFLNFFSKRCSHATFCA